MLRRLRLGLALLALGIAVVTAGCATGQAGTAAGDRIPVVATTGMVADLARNIGGDRVAVTALMGPGVDPHLFKASEGDIARLQQARIIFYNGLHLEGRMGDILVKMAREKPTVAVAERIPEERLLITEDGVEDPHIWFDVSLWMEAAAVVRDSLVQLDPEGASTYRQNAEAYLAELKGLDEWARAELATINVQLSRKIEEVQSLQEALRAQAVRDALTGLFNRRHLAETLPTLFALARRERQPLALAIIDLDHFKRVNDRHGHAAGDRLLQAFGELLASQLRRSDVACRYGGEEFCLLMPRTGADAARRKVQALLRRWRAMRFEIDDDEVLEGQSFSAGVADTLAAAPSPDALLKAADDELLAAKRAGRNRVTVSRGGATAADTLH